jgi:hypothetical protein
LKSVCSLQICYFSLGSYECECKGGYGGSRCERYLGRNEEQCKEGQSYVPYPSTFSEENNKEPVEPESEKTEAGESSTGSDDVCFSGKNVTTLYFDIKLLKILKQGGVKVQDGKVKAAMRIEVEDWLKKVIEVWYAYADSFSEEGSYNLSDVSVLDDMKVNAHNISVPVVARVGHKALSREGFLCSFSQSYPSKNCSKKNRFPDYTSKGFSFIDYLCPTLKDVETLKCKTRSGAVSALTGKNGIKLPGWAIYFLAILGAVLFVFVVLFACYADRSQKFNFQQALRKGQQYDHVRLPEEDDEHYLDVMLRHQVSTNGDGEVNPIYGFDEDEDESQMISNPLYGTSRGIESPQIGHARAFENPLFNTLEREPGLRAKPVGKDGESSYNY